MNDEVKKFISISSWLVAIQIVSLVAFVAVVRVLYVDVQGIKQELRASIAGSSPTVTNVANWKEYIRPHNASRGSESAPIVVVEFTDFQCPFCEAFRETTREQLFSKYGDEIRYVFKHFPLEQIHGQAKQAAVAAQCAGRDGKFWEMEKLLFRNQKNLSAEFLTESGRSLGLGLSFEECVQSQATALEVEQDTKDGLQIGISGTPTFLINGKVVAGALPLARLESIFGDLLSGTLQR